MIINRATLEAVHEYAFRQMHPNTSFPAVLSNEALEGTGYCVVQAPEQPSVGRFQSIRIGEPYLDGDEVKVDWVVETREPSLPELKSLYESAIDASLDAKAREFGYDSVYTMISYRGDPNPKFDLEARSMFAWRSAVWTQANAMMEAFMQAEGAGDIPTPEEVIAQLPAFSLLESASS